MAAAYSPPLQSPLLSKQLVELSEEGKAVKTMTIDHLAIAERMPLPDLARQFAYDALALTRAEVVLAKARVEPQIVAARNALILISGGAVLALLASIGLIVDLVIALATLVGPGFAGLVVGSVGFLAALPMGWLGFRQLAASLKLLREMVQ